jgi:hypothetical protein
MEAKSIGEVIQSNPEYQAQAEALSLTSSEPYILTPEEEAQAIDHAITEAKKWYAWRMNRLKPSQFEIEAKLSGVNFDELVNRQEVLQKANSIKHQSIWHEERKALRLKEEKDKVEQLEKEWSASQMYRLMRWTAINQFGKDLVESNDTFPLIRVLCFFLSRDPRFEKDLGYSLKKGLLIRGVSGLGKTFLAECVSANELNPITIINLKEIEKAVKQDGDFEPRAKKILYLDDVGTEEVPINYYGTKVNWFKSFIELYYMKQPFNRLIVSTNISPDEIEERYTHRVRSRMREMFNVVDVTGEDLRG